MQKGTRRLWKSMGILTCVVHADVEHAQRETVVELEGRGDDVRAKVCECGEDQRRATHAAHRALHARVTDGRHPEQHC